MGKLLYLPKQEQQEQVRSWATIGCSHDDIAASLNMPLKRLQKLFRRELELGEAEGRHQVLEKLHQLVVKGESVTATIFWVKSRCGWRDTGAAEKTAASSWPPFVVKWNGK
jgi:hypothetical protein